MSGAVIAGVATAAAAAATSIYSANKQAKSQQAAMKQAEKQAEQTAAQQRQAMRRQEGKTADVGAILNQNANPSLSGGSTLLTGAGGVKNDQMSLGSASTLG